MKSDSVDIAAVKNTAVFFTAPVTHRLHRKKPTATGFFTLAASRWRMIIGYARLSTTEQNLGLRHDDLKPAFNASVDPTDARLRNDPAHLRRGHRCAVVTRNESCPRRQVQRLARLATPAN